MRRASLAQRTRGKRLGAFVLFALIAMVNLAPQAWAQDDKRLADPDVIIEIGGLACPFCAYGIEKRLKKIDGIAELSVLLEDGKVQLKLAEGATVSEERLQKAVAEAGFEARSIIFVNEKAKSPSSG